MYSVALGPDSVGVCPVRFYARRSYLATWVTRCTDTHTRARTPSSCTRARVPIEQPWVGYSCTLLTDRGFALLTRPPYPHHLEMSLLA